MWKRKIRFFEGQTPEQRAHHEKSTRRDDALRANLCTAFEFWRACGRPICKRRQACSHDPQICFDTHWFAMPEEIRWLIRAAAKARCDGLPPDQASRRAVAEVEAMLARQAALRQSLDAARPPDETPHRAPPAPRVRGL